MSEDAVISVQNVSKRFTLRQQRGTRTLKAAVLEYFRRKGRSGREFWALRDVSFSVKRGETLGIIGANGAGKSTLLALISGTSRPTAGAIHTHGAISSLLELGAGFHPDLTGRENIFLYGAIMGLSQEQMRLRFDAIVDFAELKDWIDEPVKHYSSGMYVRLGFAVAVEVDPEILVIDEVLAVGDAAFQRKCIQRIKEFKTRGKTLLVVSHDLGTIQKISDGLLLLDAGRVVAHGDPDHVIAEYQWHSRQKMNTAQGREWGTREVVITRTEFVNARGEVTNKFAWGDPLEARIYYEASHPVDDPVFGFALFSASGALVYGNNTQIEEFKVPRIEGSGCISLRFDKLSLLAGAYLFSFSCHSSDHRTNYHRLDNAFPINVTGGRLYEGVCHMPVTWRMG